MDQDTSSQLSLRVRETGVTSYWPKTMEQAMGMVDDILARNGCGIVEERNQASGLWTIRGRFERFYGYVIQA